MILILEDDPQRVDGFRRALKAMGYSDQTRVWNNGNDFVADLADYIADADLISLDHDLLPDDRLREDWGDGYQAAKAIAEHPPSCPVIVHTTNSERGTWMMGALELGGWERKRVYPLGEDWIAEDWKYYASQYLKLG